MNDNIIPLHSAADEPQPFDFNGQPIRVVTIDGEPWFVLADACKVLGLTNPSMAAEGIDADALSSTEVIDSMGRTQTARITDESGIYALAFKSRKDEAKAFTRSVTKEVLPAIRKTGSYGAPKELTFEEMVERTLLESRARIQALESAVQELEPKANAWERMCGARGDMSASEAAKALTRGGYAVGGLRKLYALCDKKREDGGLGWFFTNGHGQREPYQRVIDQGLIRVKTGSYENSHTGALVATITPRFTAKALDAIARHIGAAA